MQNHRDVKLNIRPIFFTQYHDYVFEGPCRAGSGERLTKEYDDMANAEKIRKANATIQTELSEVSRYNILEPVWVNRNEEFLVNEEDINELMKNSDEVDVFLVAVLTRLTDIMIPFIQQCRKPVVTMPEPAPMVPIMSAAFHARSMDEIYNYFTWGEVRDQLDVLRARKILALTRVLCVSRYGSTRSVSGMDNFVNLEYVTKKLGTNFIFSNIHEFLDQLHAGESGNNPTLPGRAALNPTEEDMEEIGHMTDDLIKGAIECTMSRDDVLNSMKAHFLIRKMLKYYNCNAFTAICPDACATRRLNEERVTLCMSHSLNNGCGIASACEYDIPAALSMIVLSTLGDKPSYMGNTTHGLRFGQHFTVGVGAHRIETEERQKAPKNTFLTWHASVNLHMHGYDTATEPYLIHPFTDSKFGVTLRYDFNKDIGQEVTMCRIDPSCSKILVARGKVAGCSGYTENSCSIGVYLTVDDEQKFFEAQQYVGNHIPLIYGDCYNKVVALGKLLGLEVLEV